MSAPKETAIEVEALMRFPYRGRAYFPHQRFVVGSRVEAQELVDAKAVQIIGVAPGYARRDMLPQDRPGRER